MGQQSQSANAQTSAASESGSDTVLRGNCSHGLKASDKFCLECGSARSVRTFCSECGNVLAPGAKFCSGCGTKL